VRDRQRECHGLPASLLPPTAHRPALPAENRPLPLRSTIWTGATAQQSPCCRPGQVRDERIYALWRGARIRLWIEGPAASLAKHYASLDQIIEDGSAEAAALYTDERIGLARVDHGRWQFVVVLPHAGPPLVARAAGNQ